jgi:ABC-type branched-subunit amino acid transport system substrate-binding protein
MARRLRLIAGAVLLGAAACGTTVPGAGGPAQQPDTGMVQSPSSSSAATPTTSELDAGPSTETAQGSPGTAGGTGSAGAPAGTDQQPATRSTTPVGAAKRGFVEVGFEYATGVTEFAAALGISADIGDGMQQANAIVAWVNAHGGLAGHPIKPVFYALDLTRTDPYAQFMQEMCTLWTQDHHVVAAFAYANADYTPLARCLSKHHAVFSSYASYARDRNDFSTSPFWIEPTTLSAERLAPLQVQTFEQQGFLKGQKKVGLLAYDYAQAQRLTTLLVAELKRRGVTAVVYPIHYGSSTPELSGTIASIQSAVLRFRSEGIERVMSAAYPGAIAFFMRYADSQSYRPRYGLSSYDALASLPANAPVSQLHDAVAAGWWPTADLAASDKPPLNASGKVCRAVFSKAGIPATQDATSFGYCDEALSLQAAARSVTSPEPTCVRGWSGSGRRTCRRPCSARR